MGVDGFDTDGGSDLEDLPQDEPIKLKASRSSIDLGGTGAKNDEEMTKNFKNHSESDLLNIEERQGQTFFDDLLEQFDKKSSLSNNPDNVEHNDEDDDMIEESLSSRSNDRALQIIQENSEILERLLNKKTTPCHPDQFESNLCSNESSTGPYADPNTGHNLVPLAPSTTAIVTPNSVAKRRISHTSSNGSTGSNPSVKSSITLQSNPATKPITFNPFPNSARANRKPKEVGRKLGLYK